VRPFVGYIWIGDEPGRRLEILARSPDEAHQKVVDEYGEGHVITLRNEDDARKRRLNYRSAIRLVAEGALRCERYRCVEVPTGLEPVYAV
jgi:hypothetical protein